MQTLRLGTRASALALTQSRMVAAQLEAAVVAAGQAPIKVELIEISTHGDQDRTSNLKDFGGAGVFVKELEQALLANKVDFAVHSLKDMPIKQPEGLILAACTEREDPSDVLVVRKNKPISFFQWGPDDVLGTGAPRRRARIASRYKNVKFAEIRGNVETRLRKVADGEYTGTILAFAGLKRLDYLSRLTTGNKREAFKPELEAIFEKVHAHVMQLEFMLPSPGQGVLGLECRADNAEVQRLLKFLNHDPSELSAKAERACLERLGGGCHMPLGALGTCNENHFSLQAGLGTPDGTLTANVHVQASDRDAHALGIKAAEEIIASKDGPELIARLNIKG